MRIAEILAFLQQKDIPFTFSGEDSAEVERFSSLSHYCPGTFTWIKKQENIPVDFDVSTITLAFVPEKIQGNFQNTIRTSQSKRAFFSTMEHFYGMEEDRLPVGQFTYLSPKVKLGKNVRIGHNCTLDGDITIGDNTVIWNNVTMVNRVVIGRNCEIQSGTVIGHDGFAYTEDENHVKTMVKHFGGVTIGNDVHIGMDVVIARGTIGDTVIENGVKIDSQSMVAHNCWIEENAALIGKSMLFGSSHLRKNAYIASALVRNQCTIGENAVVGMGAVVVKDVPENTTVVGNPAKPLLKKES
ncbi:MAG: hypothetical protein GXW99_07520 [Clostridiales bacterium]|nr:hypothetical protein [Clostridiales bacterium]